MQLVMVGFSFVDNKDYQEWVKSVFQKGKDIIQRTQAALKYWVGILARHHRRETQHHQILLVSCGLHLDGHQLGLPHDS